MAELPKGLTQADLDRYAQLDAGIAALAEEHKMLNTKIKKAFKDAKIVGKKTLVFPSDKYGAIIVKIGEQKRVNAERLNADYTIASHPECFVPMLDTSLIPADVLDTYREPIQTLSVDRETTGNESPKRAVQ